MIKFIKTNVLIIVILCSFSSLALSQEQNGKTGANASSTNASSTNASSTNASSTNASSNETAKPYTTADQVNSNQVNSNQTPIPVNNRQNKQQVNNQNKLPGDYYWGGYLPGFQKNGPVVNENGVLADSVIENRKEIPKIPLVKAQAIEEAAATYGAQAGLAFRSKQIDSILQERTEIYNKVFNFNAVMIEPGFLPPVISEGKDLYNQTGDSKVRAAQRLYKIEFPARLINVAPRWQNYLMMPVKGASLPDPNSLPHSSSEKQLWNEWAKEGWGKGEKQANEIFEANVGRLRRDFDGMLRYKILYQNGLVSKPVLASSNLGVTGGGDEMAVGDRLIEITVNSSLDPNTSHWYKNAKELRIQNSIEKTLPNNNQ